MERKQRSDVKLNPLLLEPILELVFEKLSLVDLNNCLTVCTLWSKEAIRSYLKRKTIELSSQQDLIDLWRKVELNSSDHPVIDKLDTKNLNLEDPIFEKLLKAIEPKLSVLILNDGRVTLKTLHKLLRLVPNLIRLEIGTVKTVHAEFTEYHKLFPIYDESLPPNRIIFSKLKSLEYLSFNEDAVTKLSSAMKTFPNLKSLTISNFSVERLSNFDGVKMPYLEELIVLNFRGREFEMNEKHLSILLKVGFDSLKTLTLINLKEKIDGTLFQKFVERHRESLTTLSLRLSDNTKNDPEVLRLQMHFREMCLYGQERGTPAVNIFPLNLPNLKSLRVARPFVISISRIFTTVPQLVKLHLDFSEDSNWQSILPKNIPEIPQLKNLKITWIDTKSMQTLAKAFPRVTVLTMHNCDDDILRIIYESMPRLEFLVCYDSKDRKMTSEGFTGIPASRFFQIVNSSDSEEDDSDDTSSEDSDDARYYRDKPWIGQLEELKHVQLNFTNEACAGNIFEYGLMEVPSLKTTTVDGLEIPANLIDYLQSNGFAICHYSWLSNIPAEYSKRFRVYLGDAQDGISDLKTYCYDDESLLW